MSGTVLRSLIVSVTAETSAYQREMNRAARMGDNYLRTVSAGNRQAATAWNSQVSAIRAQESALSSLTGAVGGYAAVMAGALGAGSLVTMADHWGQVNARLRQATASNEEFTTVQARLMDMSRRTRTSFDENAGLFARASASMKEYGFNAEQILGVTEAIALSLKLSGASAEEASSVIRQFSQALDNGVLRGEEFNAVNESGSRFVRALAEGMGVARREMKGLADDGKLGIDRLVPAAISQVKKLNTEFEELPLSVSGAGVVMQNALSAWVGQADGSIGTTKALAATIELVADNINTLAGVAMAGGVGWLTKGAGDAVVALRAQVMALRETAGAELGRAAAARDATALAARQTAAEVLAAQAQVQATRATDAHLAALSRLRLARLADVQATQAQAAAEAAYVRASSVAGRAMGIVGGLLGGPVGLAALAATTAASFLLFSDNADAANQAASDLKRPIAELRKEWEALGDVQRRPILNQLVKDQAAAKAAAAAAKAEIEALANGPDKWGTDYKASPYQRQRAVTSFRRDIAGGISPDAATQDLIKAIGPSDELRATIEGLAGAYADSIKNSAAAGDQIAALNQLLDKGAAAAAGVGQGLATIKPPSPDVVKAWQKQIDALTEKAAKAKDDSALGEVNRKIATDKLDATPEGKALAEKVRAAAKLADAEEAAKKSREEGERKAKSAADAAARSAKQLEDSYKRSLATLEQQTALHGKNTELAKVQYETTKGELKNLDAVKKAALEKAASAKDALDAQVAYKSLMDGLLKDEEKLVATAKERVKTLNEARAAGGVTDEQYTDARARISKAAIGEAPKFSGIDASVGGASGELIKVAEAQKELEKWTRERMKAQEEMHRQGITSEQEYADRVAEIQAANSKRMVDIQAGYNSASLGMMSQLTGDAADMLKGLGQESSMAYKIMFAASKAAAIAQAIVNTEVAATKAMELGPIMGIPAASLVRGMGYASVGMIAATAIAGMAHDGIDNVPREGTWLLDQGERVVDRRTNGDLKDFLNNAQRTPAEATGGAPIVNVYVTGNGEASSESPQGLERFGTELARFVQVQYRELVARDVQPGGTIWRATNDR